MENAEMVALDACSDAPTLFGVLTTRDPSITPGELRDALHRTTERVRSRWPGWERAIFVEYTTGLSVWSGGHRRVHLNVLSKGVPVEDADELQAELLASWGRITNTTQLYVGPIYATEGLVRYVTNLALHVTKAEQRPPLSYAGHLVRWSRGYFADGATVQRERARASLRRKRALHRAMTHGMDGETAELAAQLELDASDGETWTLVDVRHTPGGLLVPGAEVHRPRAEARDALRSDRAKWGDAPASLPPGRPGDAMT